MIQKQSFNVIKGMRQDTSPSKANPEYIFDARNIRLTARGNDTLLSITNEQDSKSIYAASSTVGQAIDLINGKVLGYCVLNNYLITFSTYISYTDTTIDYITRVYKSNNGWVSDILYSSHSRVQDEDGAIILKEVSGRLNFGDNIQTLGIYENENIQKVYWVDGINQPRVINIVKDILLNKSVEKVAQSYSSDSFNFVPTLTLNESVNITPTFNQNGRFAAGVIQYAFTYFNKYGQESNIFYTSDLYYITYPNRGGSPEDIINTSFEISITNPDSNKFDYVRVYSIHRTSIDAIPYVKKVIDLPTTSIKTDSTNSKESVYYRFTGTPQVMLKGGTFKPIFAYSTYLQYNIKPVVNGTDTTGAHAGISDYYVFSSEQEPKILLDDNTLISLSGGSKLFITMKTGVGGPGNGALPIIVCDNESASRLKIESNAVVQSDITFTDNNTQGESIDPTLLLYVGGEDIVASTIAQKDNTMFLGNIQLTKPSIPETIKKRIKKELSISQSLREVTVESSSMGNHYRYSNQLCVGNTSTFKVREHYRLGLQFQYKNGKWSEPILVNPEYIVDDSTTPSAVFQGDTLKYKLPRLTTRLSTSIINDLIALGFKKVRALVVNPSLSDRLVLLQGVVCPTVYTKNNRGNNTPYAQSSWFFRLFNNKSDNNVSEGAYVTNSNTQLLVTPNIRENNYKFLSSEIEFMDTGDDGFRVDTSTVTFHSPDIEFDPSIQTLDGNDFSFRFVGKAPFTTSVGDISIETSSPTIGPKATGFVHRITQSVQSGRQLVSGLFYRDWLVDDIKETGDFTYYDQQNYEIGYLIYPWQSSGSLNNDIVRPANKGTRSAVLKRKVISNIRTSYDNVWETATNWNSGQIGVFNSNEVSLLRISGSNYYGNVDTIIIPTKEYSKVVADGTAFNINSLNTVADINIPNWVNIHGDVYSQLVYSRPSIRMKYKSTPHIVIKNNNNNLPSSDTNVNDYLHIVEIYRESVPLPFGGESDAALLANQWIPSGPPVALNAEEIEYLHGDCWYQRYDCLKTYPFTNEDENSIVEIASFMVETRVNIDGRYDRNRGLTSNLNMSPTNFNLFNPVYTQKDNFFNYRTLDKDFYKLNNFQNSITWTKEKTLSEVVDTWSNVTMTNTLDVDGNLGKITSINIFNNELYCFQDKGISNILFNNRVQIPTSDNVPIEISNGYKVQGKRYLSNSIGSQNQKSILATPNGIYFSDLYNSGIYLLNQQGIQDISTPRGFTNWVKDYQPSRTYYDANNGDVYFISDQSEYNLLDYRKCLCFSEKLNEFTSFMDYFTSDCMFNIQNNFYRLLKYVEYHNSGTKFEQMFAGDYMNNYHITYIANQNPTNDKIFNTLEFRADTLQDDQDSLIIGNNPLLPNKCPFNKLTVWNEYQLGESSLSNVFGKPSNLKQKFRIWRINIPRDKSNNRDRIRNPWAYIKLEGSDNTNRMQLHDLQVYYFDNSVVSQR